MVGNKGLLPDLDDEPEIYDLLSWNLCAFGPSPIPNRRGVSSSGISRRGFKCFNPCKPCGD